MSGHNPALGLDEGFVHNRQLAPSDTILIPAQQRIIFQTI